MSDMATDGSLLRQRRNHSAFALGVFEEDPKVDPPVEKPRPLLGPMIARVLLEILAILSMIVRFSAAMLGLGVGVVYVFVTELAGLLLRIGKAALVRSHYQPRASLDDALRCLRDARESSGAKSRAAIDQAERLIHQATLCSLEAKVDELVTASVLKKQQDSEVLGDEAEPFILVGRSQKQWFDEVRKVTGMSHDRSQSIPSYEARNHIREVVLRDPKVLAIIEELSGGDSSLVRKYSAEAESVYDGMAAKPSLTLLRFLCWFIGKVLWLFYPFGVEIDMVQVRAVQKVARQRRVPLILLPTHKSHMDYMLVTYMCFMFNLPIPHVVAGNNLNIPIVGPLLRRGGAFFIRRSFGGDKLYAAMFDAYVRVMCIHGYALECFIEGGRSRSGKLLSPKTGFLRSVVSVVSDGAVDDAIIIPISLSYDRVVEGSSMAEELAGGQKKAEALLSGLINVYRLIRDAATKKLCFGRVDIGLGDPISVREFLQTRCGPQRTDDPSGRRATLSQPISVLSVSHSDTERDAKLLGYATLYYCNQRAAILPTSLVGTVLLTQYERGIALEELVVRVDWLRRQVQARGFKVVKQHNMTLADSIRVVIEDVLGSKKSDLVKRHKDLLLLQLYNPRERLELTVLRNQLLHVFVDEAILCCSIYAAEKDDKQITRFRLYELFSWLTLLLSFEFLWEPIPRATVARSRFNDALDRLCKDDILTITKAPEPAVIESQLLPKKLARQDNDADVIGVSEMNANNEGDGLLHGTMMYLFECSLLWSFIDTYFIAALSLLTLLPNKQGASELMTLQHLVSRAQKIGEQLFFSCQIDLFEAISTEQLQNAFKLYRHWSIFTLETSGSVSQVVRLTQEFSTEAQLLVLVHRVAVYKKKARSYRSRRFKAQYKTDDVQDAIRIAKTFSYSPES